MRSASILILALAALPWALPAKVRKGEPPWEEILRPIGQPPAPLSAVEWRPKLGGALLEARSSGRPLLVTLRCLPCKQCSEFDAAVLEGGPELDPLLRQFVTVRLTDAKDMDLRLLPAAGFQDLDLSWWAYFLSSDGRLYGVFGGKDHVSDKTRISVSALRHCLERVLAHHYDPRRQEWGLEGAAPELSGSAVRPTDLPGYAPWSERFPKAAAGSCVHCHQVAEILREPAIRAGSFDKERDLAVWPLPENVGLHLDRDHGLLVTKVEADSPAAAAGIRPGDVLGAANEQRLFGQTDFRAVLHRGPRESGNVELVWMRGDGVRSATLELADGWRRTELAWRMSVSQGNVGGDPGFWPLGGPNAGKGRLSLRPFFGPRPSSPAFRAGLRGSHEVIAVDGQSPDLTGRGFLVWFRQRYEPGDPVTLRVRSGEEEQELRYRLAGL